MKDRMGENVKGGERKKGALDDFLAGGPKIWSYATDLDHHHGRPNAKPADLRKPAMPLMFITLYRSHS